jgi:hypothetical protein
VRVLDSFLTVWVLDLSEGPYWRISVTDPPIVLGEPYAPGDEPAPRSFAIVTAPAGRTSNRDLTDLILGPLAPEGRRPLDGLDRVLTPLREGVAP